MMSSTTGDMDACAIALGNAPNTALYRGPATTTGTTGTTGTGTTATGGTAGTATVPPGTVGTAAITGTAIPGVTNRGGTTTAGMTGTAGTTGGMNVISAAGGEGGVGGVNYPGSEVDPGTRGIIGPAPRAMGPRALPSFTGATSPGITWLTGTPVGWGNTGAGYEGEPGTRGIIGPAPRVMGSSALHSFTGVHPWGVPLMPGTVGTVGTAGTAGPTTAAAAGPTGMFGTAPAPAPARYPSVNAGIVGQPTANGLLIGNMALVALPDGENLTGGTTGPTTTGAAGAATGTATGTATGHRGWFGRGTTTAPGTTAGGLPAGTTVGGAAAGTTTNVPAGTTPAATGGATGWGNVARRGVVAGPPATTAAGPASLDRIRASCPHVAEIRVVTASADRARLAQILQSVRRGQPMTAFLDEIMRISRGALAQPGMASGGGTAAAPAPTSPGSPAPSVVGPPGPMGATRAPATPGTP